MITIVDHLGIHWANHRSDTGIINGNDTTCIASSNARLRLSSDHLDSITNRSGKSALRHIDAIAIDHGFSYTYIIARRLGRSFTPPMP
ncbi:MAG: hypothetical protein [Cressdnaviricota sp.]|nr:MAG: hypothetical protein [Cressdnaviricota sp.]